MTTDLAGVMNELGIGEQRFGRLVEELRGATRRRYTRLWAYYANPMRSEMSVRTASDRPYRQAQEWGVPARITGYFAGTDPLSDGTVSTETQRKELVIENDIAWRVDTMVEYLFGKLPLVQSTHADTIQRERIDRLLQAIWDHNGGTQLLQQMALIGAVYGFVDVAVTFDATAMEDFKRASGSAVLADTGNTPTDTRLDDQRRIMDLARLVCLKIVEPARSLAIPDAEDATTVLAYAQVYDAPNQQEKGMVRRLVESVTGPLCDSSRVVELWSESGWWRWRGEALEASGGNTLGRIPVVHIQNTAMPFAYDGASDVEPLIPLQDELNTRLSDRAHRIAIQSFKMYLGKGLETFKDEPPTPGRVWQTANLDASIQELGGDASCPSEETHIAEVREAMDRSSGVPPVAAGAIRNRIGNLTSAAALRITLMSLLARTERKRALYGEGIERICECALAWLDAAGVFASRPEERGVEIRWASPLPENDAEKLAEAKLKLDVGVGKEVVLRELGY